MDIEVTAADHNLGDEIKLQPLDTSLYDTNVSEGTPPKKRKSKAISQTCEACGIVCNSEVVYEAHIKGLKHMKKVAQLAKASTETQELNISQCKSDSSIDEPCLSDATAVLNFLNVLANSNNTPVVFTTTGEPSNDNAAAGSSNCYEVKLTFGDQTFTAKGSSFKEAQHLASVMALEKGNLKRPSREGNLSPSIVSSQSSNRFVAKRLFPVNGYPSALVCEQQLVRKHPADSEIEKFIHKNLVAPTTVRHALHSLADYAIRTLSQTANSLITHYRALNEKRIIDKDLIETPPSLLDPVRLCQSTDEDYARLLWAIRVGPITVDLLNKHDRSVRIVVMCSQLPEDSDEAEKAFIEEVRSKMPEAEQSNQNLILKRKLKHQNKQIELVAEIVFVGLRLTKVAPTELRRQLLLKQYIHRNKTALDALRILRELSINSKSGFNVIPQYTWEVLICILADNEQNKKCAGVLCASVIGKLAGGILLANGAGLVDPCDDSNTWDIVNPPCAGIPNLSSEDRVAVTKQAQKILIELVHPYIKSPKEFVQKLISSS